MRLATVVVAFGGMAACFSPTPQPGGTCAEGGQCPEPLVCDEATNTCQLPGGPGPDADGGGPDACIPVAEICDGVDQDCDGAVDEDFATLGDDCMVGTGACEAAGTIECNSGGSGVVCTATRGGPAPEICEDGIDQDCDDNDPPCPANDTAAGAIDLSAGGDFTGELAVARDDAEGSCGAGGGRDLFYEITVMTDEVAYVDSFGSDFDVAIRLHDGPCAAMLPAEIACYDDSCGGAQVMAAGLLSQGTYCIVVDQENGAAETTGHVELHVIRGRRPGIALPAMAGTMTGTTVGGQNLTVPICEGDSDMAPDVGYFFTVCPGVTRTVTADTCENTNFDSWLSIREGDGRNGPELACLDDACGDMGEDSMISEDVTGPGLFWLLVDGWENDAGSYEMDYSIQ
jgi:hypothetical protein